MSASGPPRARTIFGNTSAGTGSLGWTGLVRRRLHPSIVDWTIVWSVGDCTPATWCAQQMPYCAAAIGAIDLAVLRRSSKYSATWSGCAGNGDTQGNRAAQRFQPSHTKRYLSRVLLKQERRPARSSLDPPNTAKSNGTDPSKRPLPKRLRRGGTEHGDWLGHNYYLTG